MKIVRSARIVENMLYPKRKPRCSVDGSEEPAMARKLCSRHYHGNWHARHCEGRVRAT
jgi:hypothetical protein